jgi:hypothetical protein
LEENKPNSDQFLFIDPEKNTLVDWFVFIQLSLSVPQIRLPLHWLTDGVALHLETVL